MIQRIDLHTHCSLFLYILLVCVILVVFEVLVESTLHYTKYNNLISWCVGTSTSGTGSGGELQKSSDIGGGKKSDVVIY